MKKLTKGQEVILIRTASVWCANSIFVEKRIVQSSGNKETMIQGLYTKFDTGSITRTLDEIKNSNIVGTVIVNKEDIEEVIKHIKKLQIDFIKSAVIKLKKSPDSRRYKLTLRNARKKYTIVYGEGLKPEKKENIARAECEYKSYDYKGNELIIDNEGNYSDIPEKCPECHCVQSEPNYKDFSNKCIHICEQCNTEIYLSCL